MNTYIVRPEDEDREWRVANHMLDDVKAMAKTGMIVEVRIGEQTRSRDQNSLLWAALSDISKQVPWHGMTLKPEDWKDIFTASLRQQRLVPGLDGGFVALGMRTSKMRKGEFSDLIEIMHAFGASHDVKWSERASDTFEQYREAVL